MKRRNFLQNTALTAFGVVLTNPLEVLAGEKTDSIKTDPMKTLDQLKNVELPAGIRERYVSGAADWATFRPPGALEQMQLKACTKIQSFHIIKGAGHWLQQEQPEQLTGSIVDFLQHAK